MSNFTNLAFANTPQDVITNKEYGIHSLLKLQDIFVNQTIRWHYHLRDDYVQNFATLCKNVYEPLISNGTLLGFFLGDELLWNGMTFTEMETYSQVVRAAFPRKKKKKKQQKQNNIHTHSNKDKQHTQHTQTEDVIIYTNGAWPTLFPTTPGEPTSTGNIGAVPLENIWLRVPNEIDWWGVDLYPDQYSQLGAMTVLHSNVLRKFTTPEQRLVLVPPFYGDRKNSTSIEQRQMDCGGIDCDLEMFNWMETFNQTYFNQTYEDSKRVVAAMPYHWMNLHDGNGIRDQGGVELVKARVAWEDLGRAVVAQENKRRDESTMHTFEGTISRYSEIT